MNVLIDISHLAQYNFYKNVIIKLTQHCDVHISVLNRGALYQIVTDEIGCTSNLVIKKIGSYSKNFIGKFLISNVVRVCTLLAYCMKIKPSIVLSNGYQAALVGALCRIPRYQFGDDPEHYDRILKTIFSCKSSYCIPNCRVAAINTIEAPKEWSYLSPEYFVPYPTVLTEYGITEGKYVFIREISNKTTNYHSQESNLLLKADIRIPEGYKVVLSLETMEAAKKYPSNWLLIRRKEPNIHSLVYYSALLISSGDSMAREGASLGVPSIYCGNRHMLANQAYMDLGLLMEIDTFNLQPKIDVILSKSGARDNRQVIRESMKSKWIDVNDYIVRLVIKETGCEK